MVSLGFTGTRNDITDLQIARLHKLLQSFKPRTETAPQLHHGDCVGADAVAHRFARDAGFFIIAHPPTHERWRAFCAADVILPKKNYLERNRDIVHHTDMLIACPFNYEPDKRNAGGTWYTVRYARKLERPITLIMPDGKVIEEDA